MRSFNRAIVVGALAGTVLFTGCSDPLNWGAQFKPSPSAAAPSPSASSAAPATSPAAPATSEAPSPSESPSEAAPAVGKASGSMKLYQNVVTERFTGTCTTADTLKIVVGDHANDFYGTVDGTIVLAADASTVNSISVLFGEDSEGITRQITYNGSAPAKGTSAKLTSAGQRYQISGTGLTVETRNGKDSSRLIPYALDLTCTSSS